MKLSKFVTFCLIGRGNPANQGAALVRLAVDQDQMVTQNVLRDCAMLSPWSLELAASAPEWEPSTRDTLSAHVEFLNKGSNQRLPLLSPPPSLKGSGRWQATDKGGQLRCLMSAIRQYHTANQPFLQSISVIADILSSDDTLNEKALILWAQLSRARRRLERASPFILDTTPLTVEGMNTLAKTLEVAFSESDAETFFEKAREILSKET